MATRRRGADLSDLKSRLGLPEDPAGGAMPDADSPADAEPGPSEGAPAAAPAAASASPPPASSGAGAAPSAPPASAPSASAPQPSAPPAPRPAARAATPGEDYGSAVSDTEAELPPVAAAPTSEDDGGDLGDVSGPLPMGLLIAVGFAALVALVLGYLAGSVFDGRRVVNSQIAEAERIQADVDAVARQINDVRNALDAIDVETAHRPEFDTLLRNTWENGAPVLEARVLSASRTLMAYNEELSRRLLDYAMETQLLNSLVQQHLRLSARDAEQIQRELGARADTRNFGLVFDFRGQASAYQRFIDDPEANPFQPVSATRVTFDALVVDTQGENDFFSVTFLDGQARNIPVINLVSIPRDQLVEDASTDTALSRWRGRATTIRDRVTALAESQARLRESIADIAERDRLFTL